MIQDTTPQFNEDELIEALFVGHPDHISSNSTKNSPELLTVKLIREAIRRENPGDAALDDFARLVVPKMLMKLAGHTAKGGLWIERRREKGKMKSDRSGEDQSLTAHLLNGLLPVTALIRRLRQLDTSVARYIDEKAYRFFIASYILHDWEKLPHVADRLEARFGVGEGFKPDPIKHRDEFEQVLTEWTRHLGLDEFLATGGLGAIGDHLDTLAYIAQNTQEKYDTHAPTIGFKLTLPDRVIKLCANLTKLSDKLASIVKHPSDIAQKSLNELLYILSDAQLQFTYHAIAEVRGVLTNIINNALLDAYREKGWEPFLFFPNGAAYFGRSDYEPVIDADVPDAVVAKIKSLCEKELERRFVGFERDRSGKGLKFADYYWRFFDIPSLIEVGARATFERIRDGNKSVAANRSASIVAFQKKDLLTQEIDAAFTDDIRIDQLAEFCDLIERKIVQVAYDSNWLSSPADLRQTILSKLGLLQFSADFEAIDSSVKSKAGGVPLAWYFAAATFFKQSQNKGKSPSESQQLVEGLAAATGELIAEKIKKPFPAARITGWDDLRCYVNEVVSLPQSRHALSHSVFAAELDRYEKSKLRRGVKPCSLCSSSYDVSEQMESGVLFAPQVFTNKQVLFGSQAKRHICSVCSTEMMLRQILMNRTQASGGDFEGAKYRYLYIYPTYYFSAETNRFLREAYQKLSATSFRTGVRDHLIARETREVDFSIARFQSLDSLLIDESLDLEKDQVFKMKYPEDEPLTFFFAGLRPGRDATDTESWVMPVFLSLVLPFVFDAKVVISESPAPLFNSGADFEETVFIDAPHSFAELLVRKTTGTGGNTSGLRLRLDEVEKNLQRLTAAYVIHLDANARQSKGGYDANWGKMSELARDLATSPLYVFHYLNVWLRKQGFDTPPIDRVRQYLKLYEFIDPEQKAMNHPRKLTELYRRFYRAKSQFAKANAILKPIDLAADALIKADRALFVQGDGALVDVVAAELNSLMQRVHRTNAEGRWVISIPEEERRVVREFAEYFVNDLFLGALKGDVARLAGTQLNFLRNACETLYRETDDRERAEKKAMAAAAGADAANVDSSNEEELEG